MALRSDEDRFREMMRYARSDKEREQIAMEWERYQYHNRRAQYLPDPWLDAAKYQQMTAMMQPVVAPKPAAPLPEEHLVSAIIGHRAWNVPLFVDELRSVAKPSKWKPYQRFEAECASSQCGGVSCTCGIYAFKTQESVQSEYRTQDRSTRYVYGECWLWGRILECKDGYRAQFAYPKSFVNTGAIAKRMSEIFGIELTAEKL